MPLTISAADRAQLDKAQRLFHRGKFAQVIRLAAKELETEIILREDWYVIKAQSELTLGRYADCRATTSEGLQKELYSIRLRWVGATASEFCNEPAEASKRRSDLGRLIRQSSWRYRESHNQLVMGEYLLSQGVDAKGVMDEVYSRSKDRDASMPHPWMGVGKLALEKSDFDLASQNFAKVIELDPSNPDGHYGLARAYRSSLPEKSQESLKAALAINERHIPSLLMLVEQQVAGEAYVDAAKSLDQILEVNPHHPEAWAFRAVLAHLAGDTQLESRHRERALEHWPSNPVVDHVIGRELSKKYRFEEGSGYQRSSLGMSPDYLPSKMQLAHDLLRLGQELEGWKLAEEVFDADQYNVVANNLVALRDNLSEFATLEKDGFVVRMERGEADCYGHMVFELLEDASQQLTKKYEVELQKPIFIEIFPRQQDFAIRTFGLPGGAGFLGVCFGRVVTMNSPVAQGASQTNWRSVLWHEFCHVVTLQKTKNKMPRWLSEGISVYEERLANSAWGDSIDPGHRMMIIGGELTPVSQLSNAFLSPKSAQHLQFAYFESSLVVEYLIGKFGEHAMVAMLDDLGTGMPINDALQRHMASTAYLDKEFAKYARKIASGLAPDADWTPPKEPIADVAGWEKWLGQHPKNYYGLLGSATVLVKSKKFERALERLDELDAIYGNANGAERAYRLRATANRGLQRESAERDALEKAIGRDASDLASCSRLLDIYSANGKWEDLKRVARRMQGINPLLKSSHRKMAMAAEKSGDDTLLIQELKVLLSLKPFDRADTHYRLGAAQLRQGDRDSARRNALLALEAAPRYRDAHKLLLKSLPAEYDESTDQPQGTDDE